MCLPPLKGKDIYVCACVCECGWVFHWPAVKAVKLFRSELFIGLL